MTKLFSNTRNPVSIVNTAPSYTLDAFFTKASNTPRVHFLLLRVTTQTTANIRSAGPKVRGPRVLYWGMTSGQQALSYGGLEFCTGGMEGGGC